MNVTIQWRSCPQCKKEMPVAIFEPDKRGFASVSCLCCQAVGIFQLEDPGENLDDRNIRLKYEGHLSSCGCGGSWSSSGKGDICVFCQFKGAIIVRTESAAQFSEKTARTIRFIAYPFRKYIPGITIAGGG